MFIELVDSLRCLGAHDETWLVAAVTRMDGRHIAEGTLGCPICRREYPVRGGVGWFTSSPSEPVPDRLTPVAAGRDEARVVRAAALLGLLDSGGIVCLGDSWVECADSLAELGPAHVVVLNAAPGAGSHQSVSSLVVDDRLPFATGSLRGAALGAGAASASLLASAAGLLRSRGRLVAPASASIPDGMIELARDADDWVAERAVVASPPVPLRSAKR